MSLVNVLKKKQLNNNFDCVLSTMICAPFTVPLRHANYSFATQIAYSLLIAAYRNSNINNNNNFLRIPKLINCRGRFFYGTIIDLRFAHIQLYRWYSRHIHWAGLFSRMCGIILVGIALLDYHVQPYTMVIDELYWYKIYKNNLHIFRLWVQSKSY